MAIEGKKPYKIYLDEKNVEFLRNHFDKRPNTGGLSALLDKYVARCVCMLENNSDIFDKIKPGKLTFKKFWQLTKLNVRLQNQWKDTDNNDPVK